MLKLKIQQLAIFCLLFLYGTQIYAVEKIFLVGGEKEKGEAAAATVNGTWVKNLSKAFVLVSEAVHGGEEISITLKIASGNHDGDLGSGAYQLPLFDNPKAHLLFEGGYNTDFSSRNPFTSPTQIITVADRSAPLIQFTKNSKLASFVVDGLVFDTANSNKYDAKTNSLLISSSSTHTFFQFNYLETTKLAFYNSVFLNAANRIMEPLIRAASPDTVIEFKNDIFLNNRIPLKLDSARYQTKPTKIIVDHCSFLLNWAYNPDPGTGNPAALEIGPEEAAKEIVITNNLFYANFGGAILALNNKMPPLTISKNNFVGNGLLHGDQKPEAVAMIVTAGGKKQPLAVNAIEDVPAVSAAENNVSIAPGIALALGEVKTVDASQVKVENTWENEVRRILGLNLQGSTVAIKDYAPRKEYDPQNPPFPTKEEAKLFGASANLLK